MLAFGWLSVNRSCRDRNDERSNALTLEAPSLDARSSERGNTTNGRCQQLAGAASCNLVAFAGRPRQDSNLQPAD